jgi:hypothetical protein
VSGAALQVYAGSRALAQLRERGLQPGDVRVVPAAAGGPKGLVLNPLDRFLFGEWLPRGTQAVHLLGASIGAWRMASACLADPGAALARLAEDYITQRYEHAPGKAPAPAHVSAVFGEKLVEHFGGREAEVLGHPRYRLHVFTSRGRHVLAREGRLRTPAGYLGAFAGNALHRRALGAWLQRVVFSDPREPLPVPLDDLSTEQVTLTAANLQPAVLASCSIPFWLRAVHDIPGAPRGAYWDGGITDYHLHLGYAAAGEGLVLYPHFQPTVVPGWLDKPWRRRHRATPRLDNVVLLVPHPDWVRTLPGAKLPDRGDFKTFVDDEAGRERRWRAALAESARLADEFAALVQQPSIEAVPLP